MTTLLLKCQNVSLRVPDRKVDMSVLSDLTRHVDPTEPRFLVAVIAIIFNPFFWNVCPLPSLSLSLSLYYSLSLSLSLSPCLSVSSLVLTPSTYYSAYVSVAMGQPRLELMDRVQVYYAGAALLAVGSLFVISSFLALGFTGTFLGDYFGILMEQKVTGFPFNVLENPMYWGSTANYLGLIGIFIFALIAQSYRADIWPFTEEIYRRRSQRCKHQ
uniref:Phosphatidylethanolamine N-methyltransferase n=1 Tax=Astyanax mexicanus TaxID=7994 RepID=A0A8B9JWC8_ASTMX